MLDPPESVCLERNSSRADRAFGAHVVRRQRTQLHRSIKHLKREGFRNVWVLDSLEEIAEVEVTRTPLWTDRRAEHGPFDVIGDIHGCYAELVALLAQLGYAVAPDGVTSRRRRGGARCSWATTATAGQIPRRSSGWSWDGGRRHGDLHAREPRRKLARKLKGRDVKVAHGLAETLEQLEPENDEFREQTRASSMLWSATRSSTMGLSLSRTPG